MSETKTQPIALPEFALQRNDIARPVMFAKVKNDVTFEDVMTPAFWRNCVPTFVRHQFSQVHVIREDGTMILELVCISAKPGMAVMHCKYKYVSDANLKATKPKEEGGKGLQLPPGYKWSHVPNGANAGHMVRLPSGEVLVQGKASKEEAVRAAIAHAEEANSPVNA